MPTYLELKQQIETLQAEAEAVKAKERGEVIEKMLAAVAAYDITAEELGLAPRRRGPKQAGTRATAGKKSGKTSGKSSSPYSDDQGNTWGGRGPRPKWLRDALAGGAKLEDFARGRGK